jgi:hypothetical protein
MKVINQLIKTGALPLAGIPSAPLEHPELFDSPPDPLREKQHILRADLVIFMEKALLCRQPVLDPD